MHPALWKLLRLRWRGSLRQLLRSLKTVRGAVLYSFVGGTTAAFLAMLVVGWMFQPPEQIEEFRTMVQQVASFALLGMWIMVFVFSAGEQALGFNLAEVAFLFPAPISRRQLIIYKLASAGPGILSIAVLFMLFGRTACHSWFASFVGLVLLLGFFQLSLVAGVMLRQVITERAYNWSRRLLLAGALALVAAGIGHVAATHQFNGIQEALSAFRQSWPGKCLSAPFEVFVRVVTAERLYPDALVWAAVAVLLNGALVVLILRLDANYLAAAAAGAQKRYEATQRFLRGGWLQMSPIRSRRRLPRFPWLAGFGPIAWRQSLHLLRTLAMLVYLAASFSAAGIVAGLAYDTAEVRLYVLGALGYMAVMVSYAAMFLPLGMRADIDRFDTLKSLPTASAAVVAGQIIPAGCLLSLVQCLLLGAGVVVDARFPEIMLGAACFTLPLNLLILACNDLLFLLFPARIAAGTAASVQISARHLATVMIFLPGLLVLIAMAVGCGAIVSLVLNNSALAFASGAWCAIWLEVAAILALATWLFGRFDVSLETPPE